MAITLGQQLGSYEVTALLGKGGMGEVYRARDTKLKRDVAVKILPDEFSLDRDRVSRFQREAEVLASLNHPNIAAMPVAQPARLYNNPRISPDGQRVVFSISSEMEDIWIYDLVRGTMQRVTAEGNSGTPIWATNTRLIYERRPLAGPAVMSIALDGNGAPSVLARAEKGPIAPSSVSADGKIVIGFYPFDHGLWVLPLAQNPSTESKAQPFLDTRFTRFNPDFSPDGRWVAFRGDDTGRSEIYVASYPGPGEKIPISNDGGSLPRWSRSGRELFYRSGNKLMVVDIQTSPSFRAGIPKVLFEGPYSGAYDVSADGKRFLMLKENTIRGEADQLNIVLNWFEELRQRVPAQ